MIDIHCHILPGLDDGAQSLDEAVEMARIAEKDGIEKIVATPHLFRGSYMHEDLSIIEDKRKELNKTLKVNNIHVEILNGAEVYIVHNLIDEIRKNRDYLVLNKSAYMFVEFPSEHIFPGVQKLFFELMREDIIPVIAHPERNSVFVRHPSLLYELVQMGATVQANRGSFLGVYGKETEEAVLRFLELNLIHFIASDGHNTHSLVPRISEAVMRVEAEVGDERARALVVDNPKAVLEDRELPFFTEAVNPDKKEKKLSLKIPFLK